MIYHCIRISNPRSRRPHRSYLAVLGRITVAECRGDHNQQRFVLDRRDVVVGHAVDLLRNGGGDEDIIKSNNTPDDFGRRLNGIILNHYSIYSHHIQTHATSFNIDIVLLTRRRRRMPKWIGDFSVHFARGECGGRNVVSASRRLDSVGLLQSMCN